MWWDRNEGNIVEPSQSSISADAAELNQHGWHKQTFINGKFILKSELHVRICLNLFILHDFVVFSANAFH